MLKQRKLGDRCSSLAGLSFKAPQGGGWEGTERMRKKTRQRWRERQERELTWMHTASPVESYLWLKYLKMEAELFLVEELVDNHFKRKIHLLLI